MELELKHKVALALIIGRHVRQECRTEAVQLFTSAAQGEVLSIASRFRLADIVFHQVMPSSFAGIYYPRMDAGFVQKEVANIPSIVDMESAKRADRYLGQFQKDLSYGSWPPVGGNMPGVWEIAHQCRAIQSVILYASSEGSERPWAVRSYLSPSVDVLGRRPSNIDTPWAWYFEEYLPDAIRRDTSLPNGVREAYPAIFRNCGNVGNKWQNEVTSKTLFTLSLVLGNTSWQEVLRKTSYVLEGIGDVERLFSKVPAAEAVALTLQPEIFR